MISIIDTHQHLMLIDRWPYSWSDDVPRLKDQAFTPQTYAKHSEGTGIIHTVFMETTPDDPYWIEETKLVCEMSDDPDSPMIGAIVNCAPEKEEFEAFIDEHAHPRRLGLRRILHVAHDDLSRSQLFRENIRTLAKRDLTFDLCVFARQLPIALELVDACPDVRFILDHCGVPDIANKSLDPWRQDIRNLAARSNVSCKISGLLAYCKPGNVTKEAILPFVEHSIECFGWDRVIWGGDWPVCTTTTTLSNWINVSREIVSSESEENQKKLFFDNAVSFYHIHI